MKGYKAWGKDYSSNRYMKNLSLKNLSLRGYTTLNNLLNSSSKGIGIIMPTENDSTYWYQLFTHFLYECEFRNIDYKKLIYKYNGDKYKNLANIGKKNNKYSFIEQKVNQLNENHTFYLIKYGEKKHISSMYNYGQIRVSAASSYNDSKHNEAIKDDELTLKYTLPLPPNHNMPNYSQILNLEIKSKTDFYTFCLAHSYRERLFNDFNANSCIIIYDVAQFANLLNFHTKLKLGKDWIFSAKGIDYFDPLGTSLISSDVIFSKDFEYWYQKEYRFSFIPPTPTLTIEPYIDIEIGSLTNISEYFDLEKY